MDNLTLDLTKSRLKAVEQKLKDESSRQGETANKASFGKDGRKCFCCGKSDHIKIYCYRWLAIDEGKEYTKTHFKEEKVSKIDENSKGKSKDAKSRSRKHVKSKKAFARTAKDDSNDSSDFSDVDHANSYG